MGIIQTEFSGLDHDRARKLADQRVGSKEFWKKAKWSKQEKGETLAAANKARDKALASQTKSGEHRSFSRPHKHSSTTEVDPRNISYEDLELQVKEKLEQAEQQQRKRAAEHGKSDAALSFLTDFLQFVGEFSGVIEIMKGVDEGYGGAAYAALSVFLSVAVNTKKKDDMIANAMINLREHYGRMVIISDIYPTPEMRRYITEAYALGLEFVVEAREYYTRSVWRRLLESVTKPAFVVDRKISEISVAMTRIKEERDTLLNKRIHEINNKVDSLAMQVDEVKHDVGQASTDVRQERIATLRESLSGHIVETEKPIAEYSALLENSFDLPPGLARFDLEILKATKEYKSWSSSRSNCMLLLHGETKADRTSLCWLSPAAISLAAFLRKQAMSVEGKKVAVAEVYCRTSDFTAGRRSAVSDCSVILSFVPQLLEADPTIVASRKEFFELQSNLDLFIASTSRNESVGGRKRLTSVHDFSNVCDILSRDCISHFDEVYLIIDRVDRISGPESFLQEFMTKIVEGCRKARVRVMCVAAREGAGTISKIDEVCKEFDDRGFVSLRMDQDRA
ncbi:hypothetical protein G7054_g9216 [Neopestalotiopsis clavispora]|nr:hypothetical protein G7054_g9216 [Neopestalotiopsis clavispora]